MKNTILTRVWFILLLMVSTSSAYAVEYKCYVTGSDSLHYLVVVDVESSGMAILAARHVKVNSPVTGKVGVQGVQECTTLDKPFRHASARKLEEKTPIDTITNSRK